MHALLVLLVSAGPAIAFLVLIMRMDRAEPEQRGLVVKIIGLGALSAGLATLVEMALQRLPFFGGGGLGGAAVRSLLMVAPVEEACKLGVVLLFVWDDPNFNEENDGIVYLGASAIGFALLENIAYVVGNGLGTGVLRAFTAVPLHVFTAVVMGLSVGRARFAEAPFARKRLVLQGFLIAWFFHGVYDTLAGAESALSLLLLPLLGGLAAFGILTLKRGRRISLLRWKGPAPAPADVSAPADLPPATKPGRTPLWMAVIARILLAGCVLFWILLAIGMSAPENRGSDAILGGILITFIPAAVGILLELSWQRRKRFPRS